MLCAFDIKSILADHLLQTISANSILAVEVPFCYGFRRADMLFLEQEKTHAFEIKSDLDSLDKLEDQIQDYRNTFSYSWLVTTAKHLPKARKKVSSSIGIIMIQENGGVQIVRYARENKRLSKNNLVFLLEKNHLVNLLKEANAFPKQKVIEIGKLRELGEARLTTKQLVQASYDALLSRYKKAYELFSFDRGMRTTHDDIYYLSGAK